MGLLNSTPKYYRGSIINSTASGNGIEYYDINLNIIKYNGQFQNNQYNGKGKYYYSNSKLMYDGNFIDGLFNSTGKLYNSLGSLIFDGIWKNGYPMNGIYYENNIKKLDGYYDKIIQYKPSNVIALKLLIDKNRLCTIYNNDGNIRYEGKTLNNYCHGYGKIYLYNIPKNEKFEYSGIFNKFNIHKYKEPNNLYDKLENLVQLDILEKKIFKINLIENISNNLEDDYLIYNNHSELSENNISDKITNNNTEIELNDLNE